MTPPMPTLRFVLTAIAVVALTAAVLLRYAKACRCDNCSGPWAVRIRASLQLCRGCATSFDRHWGILRRRRSLLRRLFRTAA